jgi:hypothetical protein
MYAPSQLQDWIVKETASIVGIVEATSYEKFSLWMQHAKDGQMEWKQGNGGPLITAGTVDGRPVCLALFIEATSQLVDWKLIDEYVKTTWPNVSRTDPMNFCNILR